MDGTAIVGIVGIVASLGGVYLGARMGRQTARDLAQDERKWAETQSVRQRQDQEAAKLDERLLEAMAGMPTVVGPARETGKQIAAAHVLMLQACSRGTVLDDPEIYRRVRALDLAMLVASDHAQMLSLRWSLASGEPEPTLNPWPLSVAYSELREALSCFQRHKDPPEAKFPTSTEVVELAHKDGQDVGLDAVRDLLMERQAPP